MSCKRISSSADVLSVDSPLSRPLSNFLTELGTSLFTIIKARQYLDSREWFHTEVGSSSKPSSSSFILDTWLRFCVQVVRMLVSTHPNLMTCHTRRHTPLHLAARNGHHSTIQTLLEAGMDVNCVVRKKKQCLSVSLPYQPPRTSGTD